MTLKNLTIKLNNRFTKTGNHQFKEGIDIYYFLNVLKNYLNILMILIDYYYLKNILINGKIMLLN